MKLTLKQAFEIAVELWTDMTKTGRKHKWDWPDWEKYGRMVNDCPFCEYVGEGDKQRLNCHKCPLGWGYDGCQQSEQSQYRLWEQSKTIKTRKKYAGLFLTQIKELQAKKFPISKVEK